MNEYLPLGFSGLTSMNISLRFNNSENICSTAKMHGIKDVSLKRHS